MLDRGLSCTDDRARWTERRRSLASLLPEPDGLPRRAPSHHRNHLVTVSRASQHSLLDPNGLPADFFTTPAAVTDLLTAASGREVDAEQAFDGLGCLHRLNLITLGASSVSKAVRVNAQPRNTLFCRV